MNDAIDSSAQSSEAAQTNHAAVEPIPRSSNITPIQAQWGPFIEDSGSEITIYGRVIFSATRPTDLVLTIIAMDGRHELQRSHQTIPTGPARVFEFTDRFPARGGLEANYWAKVEIRDDCRLLDED